MTPCEPLFLEGIPILKSRAYAPRKPYWSLRRGLTILTTLTISSLALALHFVVWFPSRQVTLKTFDCTAFLLAPPGRPLHNSLSETLVSLMRPLEPLCGSLMPLRAPMDS